MSLTRRDLYHIEFERSENISNLQSKYIEQTKSAYRQKTLASELYSLYNTEFDEMTNKKLTYKECFDYELCRKRKIQQGIYM